jgi:CheY-like chemotaxis protein
VFAKRLSFTGGIVNTQRPPPLVLLLHDHTSVVEIIAYLKRSGLRIAHQRNDDDMLAAVLTIDPDLIVLDFAVDGETVATLKGDARTHHIPLIALAEISRLGSAG